METCANCYKWVKEKMIEEKFKNTKGDSGYCHSKMGWCGNMATMSGDSCFRFEAL